MSSDRSSGGSRAESQARTRRALLDAAYVEFSSRRYSEVSVDAVAARAGYTKGAVYRNFESKAELLFEALQDRIDRVGADYVAQTLGAADEALAGDVGGRAAKTQADDIGYHRILASVWAEAVHEPAIGDRLNELRLRHRARLEQAIIDRAGAAGIDLPVPAADLAAGITNMSMATMLETLVNPDLDSAAVHETMVSVVLAGVLALAARDHA